MLLLLLLLLLPLLLIAVVVAVAAAAATVAIAVVIVVVSSGDAYSKVYEYVLRNHQLPLCLLYTSPSPRDKRQSRMPSSA